MWIRSCLRGPVTWTFRLVLTKLCNKHLKTRWPSKTQTSFRWCNKVQNERKNSVTINTTWARLWVAYRHSKTSRADAILLNESTFRTTTVLFPDHATSIQWLGWPHPTQPLCWASSFLCSIEKNNRYRPFLQGQAKLILRYTGSTSVANSALNQTQTFFKEITNPVTSTRIKCLLRD